MITHSLTQGTPEWLAHRATHRNASDAPAMMGESPYKTRSELLHQTHTGISPEVDSATQQRFDDGHQYEALARPLAEKIIGEELYPVVGSDGKLSASFDGLTMDESTAFEHKTLNDDLRRALPVDDSDDLVVALPMHYMIQMEQQCMVSGASRVLFMASTWAGNDLIEERHCWYTPDPQLRACILAGWAQFDRDLAAYVPPEVTVDAVGRAPETLPALRIEVTGMVTASNLLEFHQTAMTIIGGVNTDLETDQDFADAEKAVKWCGDVESRLAAAKQHALSQTESIDALFRTIDEISAEARAKRLELDKLVKSRKEAIREEIRQGAVNALRAHFDGINATLGGTVVLAMPASFGSEVGGEMKGKKTLASLRDAADTKLAAAKIEANATADRVRVNLQIIGQHAEHAFLFPDAGQLATGKASDDLRAIITARIAEHKAAEEKRLDAERERIRAEEQEKLARETAAAELQAAKAMPEGVELSPAAQTLNEAEGARRLAAVHPSLAKAIQPADTGATMRLGQIGTRLGFALTSDFLHTLGFEPVGRERAAVLYREADFPRICAALVRHITSISAAQSLAA
jgi:putative phage-type endonuclease